MQMEGFEMTYTFTVFKTIELDGVKYFFSKNAYNKMMKDVKIHNLDVDEETCIMYCNTFEV